MVTRLRVGGAWTTSLLPVLSVLIALAWATGAAAQYPIAGNVRFQRGLGLPTPITPAPPPSGRIRAVPGATVMQTAGPDPKRMTIAAAQLTAPGDFVVLPLFGANQAVFEVATALAVQWPWWPATFQAGGRTGPPTVTWCPGQPPPTVSYNPACTWPSNPAYPIAGSLRYVRTANQFGGRAQARFQGTAHIALRAAGTPPCHFATTTCTAIFARDTPATIGAIGAPFGWYVSSDLGPGPNPGLHRVAVTSRGLITSITETGLGPGMQNRMTSWGAPWTTGQIVISASNSFYASERFTRTGSDNRISGVGNISLITGGLGRQNLSGPTRDRGWLNLTVPEPTAALSAASAFLLLMLSNEIVCRRSR